MYSIVSYKNQYLFSEYSWQQSCSDSNVACTIINQWLMQYALILILCVRLVDDG